MNNLFEEISAALRRMRNNGINTQEREVLMNYARAIRTCMELEEEAASKLSRANNLLTSGARSMTYVADANNQLVRAKKRELENWQNLYNEVRRLANN